MPLFFFTVYNFQAHCNNIGETCYPGSRHLPIDVVYTWVNGSDPSLLKNIEYYKQIFHNSNKNDPPQNVSLESQKLKSFTGRSLLMTKDKSKLPIDSNEDTLDNPFEVSKECPIESCIKAPIVVSSSYVLGETLSIDDVKMFAGFINAIELKYAVPENSESSLLFIKFESVSHAHVASGRVLTLESQTIKFKPVFYSSQHGDGPFVRTSSKLVDVSSCNITEVDRIPGLLSYDDSENLVCLEKDVSWNLQSDCISIFPENFLVWPPWEKYMIGQLSFSDVGAHRFADNQELRYSLRSLHQYAPWVRNVYILTNGQIPTWLNINHNRIKVISHSEVFQNKSHLPTFSSPAIETNMHNIPGLSEHFLYLNDDVLFGKPVYPEDFISTEGYKVFLAWNIPNCNTGCPPNWIKDGYCDIACNVSFCNFDGGDCEPGSQSAGNMFNNAVNNAVAGGSSYALNYCNTGCSLSWVGDKYCDPACNVYNCGFDAGDCGTEDIKSQVFDVDLIIAVNNTQINVPVGIPAMYINASLHNDTVLAASYETLLDNSTMIRTAVLSIAHKILSLTFFPNRTNTVILDFLLSNEQHKIVKFYINSESASSAYIKPTKENFSKKLENNVEHWRIPEMKNIIFENGGEEKINDILNSVDFQLLSEETRQKDAQLQKLVENGLLTDKGRWAKLGQFINQRKFYTVPQREPQYVEALPQRHILDTFADSLHHVDNLYTSYFGKEQRKVLSHMPFLINKNIVSDLQSRYEK